MRQSRPPGTDFLFEVVDVAADFCPFGAESGDNVGFGHRRFSLLAKLKESNLTESGHPSGMASTVWKSPKDTHPSRGQFPLNSSVGNISV